MVEIIPKQAKKSLPWQNMAFYAAAFLLAAVITGYAGLVYLNANISAKIGDLAREIMQVGTLEDKESAAAVLDYRQKINDFAVLLKERKLASGFFGSFEKMVHPKVWFSDFELNVRGMEATAEGHAANFQSLGQQVDILKKQEAIRQISLSKFGIAKDGSIDFSLTLSFTY